MIGVVVAYIAWQQWQTARNRLKLDLFDRRLVIYQQTKDFLTRRMALGQLENNEITKFAIESRVSRWLFSPSVADYLEGELAKAAMDISGLESELEKLTNEADRKRIIFQQRKLKDWLDEQLNNVIDRKFAEFLHLKH